MKRRLLGSLGLTYGFAVIAYALRTGLRGGTVGYNAGEVIALLMAVAIIVFSGRTVIRGINERRRDRAQ